MWCSIQKGKRIMRLIVLIIINWIDRLLNIVNKGIGHWWLGLEGYNYRNISNGNRNISNHWIMSLIKRDWNQK